MASENGIPTEKHEGLQLSRTFGEEKDLQHAAGPLSKDAFCSLFVTVFTQFSPKYPLIGPIQLCQVKTSYLHLWSVALMQFNAKMPSVETGRECLQHDVLGYSRRKPMRITITVPFRVYEALVQESNYQGRSLSNLASVWLEHQAEVLGKWAYSIAVQRSSPSAGAKLVHHPR